MLLDESTPSFLYHLKKTLLQEFFSFEDIPSSRLFSLVKFSHQYQEFLPNS
jgi:hypothetical protein